MIGQVHSKLCKNTTFKLLEWIFVHQSTHILTHNDTFWLVVNYRGYTTTQDDVVQTTREAP